MRNPWSPATGKPSLVCCMQLFIHFIHYIRKCSPPPPISEDCLFHPQPWGCTIPRWQRVLLSHQFKNSLYDRILRIICALCTLNLIYKRVNYGSECVMNLIVLLSLNCCVLGKGNIRVGCTYTLIFICSLFNDSVNNSDYIISRMY
jgi:hypothetical protein